ncbi:NAD(P)/FAD-dependent oxidoreductase [Natronorubrum sp. FCH18a]|uniref:NAD(P)/FAD-dependent oxidoreductase n=1 Tax=Natronorubrum sp. FCH18a TaxID=3447018 RepID=UPI003F513DCF
MRETTEYAIIGGGIAGASIAYHLSERTDVSITVFERTAPASETTYKSVAMMGLYGDEVQYRMKRYALEFYNQFFADRRAHPQYTSMGRLVVATTEEGASKLQRAAQGKADIGMVASNIGNAQLEYIPGDELQKTLMVPPVNTDEIEGALHRPKVGYMNRPQELTYEFIERAKENGVEFRSNTPVDEVVTDSGRVTGLETEAGFVETQHVVSAAGPWNIKICNQLGLDVPLRHTLAPAIQLQPQEDLECSLPSIEPFDSPYSIHRQKEDEVIVSHYPGSYQEAGTEYDPSKQSDSVPSDIREGAIDQIDRLLPSLLTADIVDDWVGVRSLTPDKNPIVGWTAIEGFSLAAFNTSGIQLSPAVGEIIARQLVDGDPTEYYDDLSITRFDGHPDVRQ